MLKDQKIISEVVEEQKESISRVFCKFYQLLKVMKKANSPSAGESNQHNKDDFFVGIVINLCRESFNLVNKGSNETLTKKELSKFCHLIGRDLSADEFYFLTKKSASPESKPDEEEEDRFLLKSGTIKYNRR